MDVQSWPAHERARHYKGQASRLRLMAELESVEKVRQKLLSLAAQYQELADRLTEPENASA